MLDYTASAEQMGKNIGDDLAEGKVTLPLIYAKKHASPKDAERICQAIRHGDLKQLPDILQIIESTQAYDYTLLRAKEHAEQAKKLLMHLPATSARYALQKLADFIVERDY